MLVCAAMCIGTICLYYDKVVGPERAKIAEGMRKRQEPSVIMRLQFSNGADVDLKISNEQMITIFKDGNKNLALTNIVIK